MARRTRIVVIDDDENVREVLFLLFELDDRFELVGAASSGEEGFDLVCRFVPDAVVVDLDLPGLDGMAVIDRVRSLELDIRIVVFSAYPDPLTLLDVLRHGADGYLNKATAWSELLPVLDGLFHGREARSA